MTAPCGKTTNDPIEQEPIQRNNEPMGKYERIVHLRIEKLCPKCKSKNLKVRSNSIQHLPDGSDHYEGSCPDCKDGGLTKFLHFFPKDGRQEPCPESCPCRKYQ
jgi:hypothetical protein